MFIEKNYWWVVVKYLSLNTNYWLSDISYELSDIDYGLSDINYELSDVSYLLSDGNYVRSDRHYGSFFVGFKINNVNSLVFIVGDFLNLMYILKT